VNQWGPRGKIRMAGLLNSIFCRKDPSWLSRAHCELFLLMERRVPINWGNIARKALEDEFVFAMGQRGTRSSQSTAIGSWVTQFLARFFAERNGAPVARPIVQCEVHAYPGMFHFCCC
jgi:hypothetical protein